MLVKLRISERKIEMELRIGGRPILRTGFAGSVNHVQVCFVKVFLKKTNACSNPALILEELLQKAFGPVHQS